VGGARQSARNMIDGSSTGSRRESTGWWDRAGLSPRGERWLDVLAGVVVLVLAVGWTWSVANARTLAAASPSSGGGTNAVERAVGTVAAALTHANAPSAAYVTGAALDLAVDRALSKARGASGALRAVIEPTPQPLQIDSLPPGATVEYAQGGEVAGAPTGAGIWSVLLDVGNAARPVSDLSVIAMLPFSAKRNGHVGLYYVGTWPTEHDAKPPAKAPPGAYANPAGFIEVTPQNVNTQLSAHFTLGEFLPHDQPNVWPKYIVLQTKLIDKLELVLADLQARGVDVHGVRVMSGFRSPEYNYTGGVTEGRANLSRHMYGDAADIYIDDNGDGQMDDLNHDGRISIDDSRVILAAVDRVEAAHPELVGGAGVYTAAPGHGPFIHIDTRGYRARWSGTSGG
jgi:hypothetical protein